ncbi:MAG: SDR family NAD(P)-dependent oxidoreductase [Pseudomonadota bacterium]
MREKTILVTGGGSGIGLEFAREFAKKKNTVIICGRDGAKLNQAAKSHGLIAIQGDITQSADQERILNEISQRYDHLDLLINNAGILEPYDFASDPEALEKIEAEIAINAIAPLTLTRRALPVLLNGSDPAVLFIGSAIAFVANAGTPVYSGTKALIHHSAQALRHQFKDIGVSVYEAMPPVVVTEMANKLKSGNFKKVKPEDLVQEVIRAMEREQYEIVIGQGKQIKFVSRIAPNFLFRQFAKTEFH